MRIYYKKLGGHYHCRVFLNGKMGDLVAAERDSFKFQYCFQSTTVQFIPEPEET